MGFQKIRRGPKAIHKNRLKINYLKLVWNLIIYIFQILNSYQKSDNVRHRQCLPSLDRTFAISCF